MTEDLSCGLVKLRMALSGGSVFTMASGAWTCWQREIEYQGAGRVPASTTEWPNWSRLQKSTDPVREGNRLRNRVAPGDSACVRARCHQEAGSGVSLRHLSCRFRELGTDLRRCGVRKEPARLRTRPTPGQVTVPSRRQRVDCESVHPRPSAGLSCQIQPIRVPATGRFGLHCFRLQRDS